NNRFFLLHEGLREGGEYRGQTGILSLGAEFLRPVLREAEVAPAVVDRAEPAPRGAVLVEEPARCPAKSVGKDLRTRGVRGLREVLERDREGEERPEGVPPQVVLRRELLDVLRRGAARAGLEQPPTVDEWDDGKHLRARAQFQDGEQVGEVVTQHVPGARDRVEALADPFDRQLGRLERG